MVWNDVVGPMLLAVGVGILLPPALRTPSRIAHAADPMGLQKDGELAVPDALTKRLSQRVTQEHGRQRRQAMLGLALMIVGFMVWAGPWLLNMRPAGTPARESQPDSRLEPRPNLPIAGPSSPTIAPPPSSNTSPQWSPPPAGNEHLALWAIAAPGIAAMLIGGIVLVVSRSNWVRAAGAVSLATGLTANGALIKEVKISEIFKMENKIDKPTLEFELNKRMQQRSEFGPRQLAVLEGFEPGMETLPPHMEPAWKGVCTRWQQPGSQDRHGLLLVVGSTDRVGLSAAARRRYESNVGLARARAEQVKQALVSCGIPPDQLMTLVSGPRTTPEQRAASGPDPGFAQDRSVVVWALWSVPTRP
jgi:hypothetical protein